MVEEISWGSILLPLSIPIRKLQKLLTYYYSVHIQPFTLLQLKMHFFLLLLFQKKPKLFAVLADVAPFHILTVKLKGNQNLKRDIIRWVLLDRLIVHEITITKQSFLGNRELPEMNVFFFPQTFCLGCGRGVGLGQQKSDRWKWIYGTANIQK